ncbi:MAG TPA: hypothetical protein VK849_09035, partial [Longimicrobiales bacterium]|nr:hypothetical protein [Longimicrobiales bacterium]
GGFLALWIVARMARPSIPPLPPDTELPATPLQKIARWSIALGTLLAMAATALVVVNGAEATFETHTLRITFTLLLVGIIGLAGAPTIWLKAQGSREDGALDERDKAILDRAPAMQAVGMLVTLAIWIVGLAERFHDAGAVPVFYLYLIFWSCVVVDLLGLPVGVLAGYRRR